MRTTQHSLAETRVFPAKKHSEFEIANRERKRARERKRKRKKDMKFQPPLSTGLRCNITLFKCARNLLAMIVPLRQCLN